MHDSQAPSTTCRAAFKNRILEVRRRQDLTHHRKGPKTSTRKGIKDSGMAGLWIVRDLRLLDRASSRLPWPPRPRPSKLPVESDSLSRRIVVKSASLPSTFRRTRVAVASRNFRSRRALPSFASKGVAFMASSVIRVSPAAHKAAWEADQCKYSKRPVIVTSGTMPSSPIET